MQRFSAARWGPLALLLALGAAPVAAGQTGPCAEVPHCVEVTSFVATVTDFRESATTYDQVLSITVRFRNKLNRPLTLGYVQGSGLGTDDQGNRYLAVAQSLRGIGAIAGNTFDPKFVLQPGETSDARLEFTFRKGNAILGTRYVIELAVREIDPLQGNQWRLGREHSLQFSGFGAPAVAAATPAAGAPAAAVEPLADPCEGVERCYAAGPFVAELTRVAESKTTYDHLLTFTMRIRNLSNQPLVLAYSARTAVALDDRGNRYGPTSANHVRGMGVSQGTQADPSFTLRPGEAREATFQLTFRVGRNVLGTSYTFDLALEQLEMLPRNQMRTQREFAVGFRDLTMSGPNAASAAKGVLDVLRGKRP